MHDGLKSEIETKHLQSYSELTLQAPIKSGLVESLDSRTYATRLKMVMDSLHVLRSTSREYSLVRPFSDSTDRIRTINSLRMWIQEPEQKLILSVGFDRPWESYLRIIWRDVGTLLDVIFCNCVGYPISSESSFESYGRWIADARTDTRFFYNNSNFTVDDLQYLKQAERLHREGAATSGGIDLRATDLAAAKLVTDDPEDLAIKTATGSLAGVVETVTQGMQALSVLYRLADVYPPATPDGDILLRASRQLLRELNLPQIKAACAPKKAPALPDGPRERFALQLAWFESACAPVPPAPPDRSFSRPQDVQGGIVTDYPKPLTHGCVLLIAVRDAVGAAGFLTRLRKRVSAEHRTAPPADGVYVNVAFTHHGLERLGMTRAQLDAFPVEFREGMEARAGLLGDVRSNHPGNWPLPEHNWPALVKTNGVAARVQMSAVHIVVQMVAHKTATDLDHEIVGNPAHPLHATVTELMEGTNGVDLLSVQALRRNLAGPPVPGDMAGVLQARDHFGFIDGLSQPVVGAGAQSERWGNVVPLGEALLGYENASGDLPSHDDLLHNGSFLVVRKLRQNVATLDTCLAQGAQATGLSADTLRSKMLGRDIATAAPLVGGSPLSNDFDYRDDPTGRRCPLQSHVRRANPRTPPKPSNPIDPRAPLGRPTVPRLFRRGMAYGPTFAQGGPDADRGIFFMAYNASIGEQFEVVQRWVSGGNSSGAFSGEADPLLGVPTLGDPRTFRFHDGERVVRVDLDDPKAPASRPFVQLEWGAYLFAPSLPALEKLACIAAAPPAEPALVIEGSLIIERLMRLEHELPRQATVDAWKDVLEDSTARKTRRAQAVWAAIRARHAGVLRTAYGILVADKQLVMQVFQNALGHYSVCGYRERMLRSFGEIYLGLDAGDRYNDQSTLANSEILKITEFEAFTLARDFAARELRRMIDNARKLAAGVGKSSWELTLDIKEISDVVLAQVNREWFDIPDGAHIQSGGWTWDVNTPRCPGHFTAPSRYIFQPNPGLTATRYGEEHGAVVKTKMLAFIAEARKSETPPKGRISKALFAAMPHATDDPLLARTLIGIMMGYLPTVEANLRATLNEWLEDKTFWDLQAALHSSSIADPYLQAKAVLKDRLMRTMQLRPLPEITWRRATQAHDLGGVAVKPGETIVIGMLSATQQDLGTPHTPDISAVFGGNRDAPGHPQHACPGYKAAMGVLLGIIAALMEAGPLRPTPAALTLRLRGEVI